MNLHAQWLEGTQVVLVSSADHTSASTTVHDRGRPSRTKPDERRSVQTFEAQAQRQGVPGDAREWQHTRHGRSSRPCRE